MHIFVHTLTSLCAVLVLSYAKDPCTHVCINFHIGKDMGWLRLASSLKLQVSSAKDPIKETIFCKRDL